MLGFGDPMSVNSNKKNNTTIKTKGKCKKCGSKLTVVGTTTNKECIFCGTKIK